MRLVRRGLPKLRSLSTIKFPDSLKALSKGSAAAFFTRYAPHYAFSIATPQKLQQSHHPLHFPLVERYEHLARPLWWWIVLSNSVGGKKSTVRSWLRRRLRLGFTKALEEFGYNPDGTVVPGRGIKRELKGTLSFTALPAIREIKLEELQSNLRRIVKTLVDMQREKSIPLHKNNLTSKQPEWRDRNFQQSSRSGTVERQGGPRQNFGKPEDHERQMEPRQYFKRSEGNELQKESSRDFKRPESNTWQRSNIDVTSTQSYGSQRSWRPEPIENNKFERRQDEQPKEPRRDFDKSGSNNWQRPSIDSRSTQGSGARHRRPEPTEKNKSERWQEDERQKEASNVESSGHQNRQGLSSDLRSTQADNYNWQTKPINIRKIGESEVFLPKGKITEKFRSVPLSDDNKTWMKRKFKRIRKSQLGAIEES